MDKFKKTTIGSLVEFQRGFDLPKSQFKKGKYPVRSSNGVLGYHNQFKCKAPGITIGRSGTVGLPHYICEDFFPHNTTLFIKDFKGNQPKYIYYLIKNLKLNDWKSGSGVPTLNRNHLHPLEIKAHLDLGSQKQIAKVLSDLDAKIEVNNKINAELEAMAKIIYDYWFVQFDFPFDFLADGEAGAQGKPRLNGKPYKSSGGKMVYNEELKREIPEGWGNGTFETISKIVGGSTPSKALNENFTKDKNIPWITPKDLSSNKGNKYITRGEWDVTEKGMKSASLKIMPKNTVLLSSRAPIGYLAISREDVTTNQGFKSFVPKEHYPSEFIFYCVKKQIPKIEAYSSGSTFKEVSASVLKTVKISIPPKNVLDNYVKIVRPIFNKQDIIEQENQKLAELWDWLLPMLMNGQVSVRRPKEFRDNVAHPDDNQDLDNLGMVAEEREEYGK